MRWILKKLRIHPNAYYNCLRIEKADYLAQKTDGTHYNTLKTELIYQYRFETAAELDYAVSELIGTIKYAHARIHSYNGYLTPFEKRAECIIKQWCYKKS